MNHTSLAHAITLGLCLGYFPPSHARDLPPNPAEPETPRTTLSERRTCRDLAVRAAEYDDGRYWLQVHGRRVLLYCHDMQGQALEYLELPAGNCSEYASRIQPFPRHVQTCFQKVRIDPLTLRVDISDLRFSSTQRQGVILHDQQQVTAMPYATAMSCDGPALPRGRATLDLIGTDFAVDSHYSAQGYLPQGIEHQDSKHQRVELWGGGYCGWMMPGDVYNPYFAGGWNPFGGRSGYVLQLRLISHSKPAPASK